VEAYVAGIPESCDTSYFLDLDLEILEGDFIKEPPPGGDSGGSVALSEVEQTA